MREIKFRLWDKSADNPQDRKLKGVMVCWEYAKDSSYFQNALSGNYPLMQFTGLKDKNGKEIYEGDICINPIYVNKTVVAFGDEKGMGFNYSFHYANSARSDKNEWEIIGNIHENPELL